MGIPSYYKRLCDKVKGLVKSTKPVEIIHWLWVDFNCMIYHCLQRNDTEKYPENANSDEISRRSWENRFIQSVESYLERVVKLVKPSEGIFVGVDGVVPLAKMRQQRQRRFKAIWEKSRQAGTGQGGLDSWDKNAITP
ncbi:MAG: hypothetical protein EB120_14260, partial [Proteobacteria bacterium]|nr:hypothetical protein [Pseudomonadota bacterium]